MPAETPFLSPYEQAREEQIARNRKEIERLRLVRLGVSAEKKTARKDNSKSIGKVTSNTVKAKTKRRRRTGPNLKNASSATSKLRRSSRKRVKSLESADSAVDLAKKWMSDHAFSGNHGKRPASSKKTKSKRTRTGVASSSPQQGSKKKAKTSHKIAFFPRKEEDLEEFELPAFYSLREWKRARAKELGFSDPCVICHNRTLIEMVRARPKDKVEMLAIWGIGERRFQQHGQLMLNALDQWRELLDTKASETGSSSSSAQGSSTKSSVCENVEFLLGSGKPHPDWVLAQQRNGLCDGPWKDRRRWCASEMGCVSCLQSGQSTDGINWGVYCNLFLQACVKTYGGLQAARKAGWRWDAVPNHVKQSHNHRWYPPSSSIAALQPDLKLPLSSRSALSFLSRARDESTEL